MSFALDIKKNDDVYARITDVRVPSPVKCGFELYLLVVSRLLFSDILVILRSSWLRDISLFFVKVHRLFFVDAPLLRYLPE